MQPHRSVPKWLEIVGFHGLLCAVDAGGFGLEQTLDNMLAFIVLKRNVSVSVCLQGLERVWREKVPLAGV